MTPAPGGSAPYRRTGYLRAMALMLGLVALLWAKPAQAGRCYLALALALDVSSSIDEHEFAQQTNGLANAFRHPRIMDALLASDDFVTASVIHWSGFPHQEVVAPWRALTSKEAILAFADEIDATTRRRNDLPTALGKGLQHSAKALRDNPIRCARHVIDISGDGVNNRGVPPSYFAARGLFDGVIINGLVIKGADPDPEPYYRNEVIRGPGAFVVIAKDYTAYPEAIRKKLLREVSRMFAAK